MTQSISLPNDFMDEVRQDARKSGRTIDEEIMHLIQIGIAIEQSPDFDYAKIEQALNAELAPSTLSPLEHIVWFDAFTRKMAEPSEGEIEFYAQLGRAQDPDNPS
jgi:hypothetical protein